MNPALGHELDRRWKASRQAKNQKAKRLKNEFGPMTTDEAKYAIAHQLGIDLSRYLSADEVRNIRHLLDRMNAQSYLTKVRADTSRADMRKQLGHKAPKSRVASRADRLPLPAQSWAFIEDSELRAILARDYLELAELLKAKAPKSTLVLLGSMLEAILVSILGRDEEKARKKYGELFPDRDHPNKAPPDLNEWGLYQLIEVGRALSILDDNAKRIAGILKDYRNLIHPMVEMRRKANIANPHIANALVSFFNYMVDLLAAKKQSETVAP